jgi:hypothetical protein
MVYLARKITRARWESREGFAAGEIPADAVTADLRTTDNTLSFWICEPPPDDGIRAVVLALATGADRIDRMDLVWAEDDAFRANGIALNPSEGRTPVASLRGQHVDLIRLDLGRLATVATLVAEALTRNQQRRFTRRKVIEIVVEAIHHELLSVSELDSRVSEEIESAVAAKPSGPRVSLR